MESAQRKRGGPNAPDLNADYKAANRDRKPAENGVEDLSETEKAELKKRKARTERANTKPTSDKIN